MLQFLNLASLVVNKRKINYTVYASILNLICKCDEESP